MRATTGGRLHILLTGGVAIAICRDTQEPSTTALVTVLLGSVTLLLVRFVLFLLGYSRLPSESRHLT